MRKSRPPAIIDVSKQPDGIKEGDIVGFNAFPKGETARVRGSSGFATLDQFNTPDQTPMLRGIVLGYQFDSRNNDQIIGLIVMAMAPIPKNIRIENNDKNLTISNPNQIVALGMGTKYNWRLNYQPFFLPLDPKHTAMRDNLKIVRFGSAVPELLEVIMGQVTKLTERGQLHNPGILDPRSTRELQGREVAAYDRVAGTEARVGAYGNKLDAQAVATIEADQAAEGRAVKRAVKRDAKKTIIDEMKKTPSGALAFRENLRFAEGNNPDISLQSAHDMGLIDEDTHIILDHIESVKSAKTLRCAYDAIINEPDAVKSALLAEGACTEKEQEEYFSELQATVKSGLQEFYRILKSGKPEKRQNLETSRITYEPKLAVETVEDKQDVLPEEVKPKPLSLGDAFEDGSLSGPAFLYILNLSAQMKKPIETLSDAFDVMAEYEKNEPEIVFPDIGPLEGFDWNKARENAIRAKNTYEAGLK